MWDTSAAANLNRAPPPARRQDVRIPLVTAADAADAPQGHGRTRRVHEPSDDSLVRRIMDGDQTALGAVYDRYGRPAFSLARRICADEGLAEDVVQEVFLAFWRDPQRYDRARGSFGTWLLTLVHHKSVDVVRRESAIRRRTAPPAEDGEERSAPMSQGADHDALEAVVAGQVREALSALPADQRKALALAYYGGYTQREVAALTGVPLGTVKSRMFAGVQRLRGVLGPLFGDVGADMGGGAR